MNRESLSLRLNNNQLSILDQQLLPDQEVWVDVKNPDHMVEIIQSLKVRGAPLIGVAAALSLALWNQENSDRDQFLKQAQKLRESRPTAVNLMNALDRMLQAEDPMSEALTIFDEDVELCNKMAKAGSSLVKDGDHILTHCNTGGLATVGVGTALGVITQAHSEKKNIHVYVDETRPLLQGGRLTTWELEKAGVPYSLICDNMSGSLMSLGKVSKVFLGADRIATNGDFANKIGTYNLAVLCWHHNIPFYVVAPKTTIDPNCKDGRQIPVEMRKDQEVRGVFGHFGDVRWAPASAPTYNPAFDVTPVNLVTGMIIDDKVYSLEDLQAGKLEGSL